MVTVELHMKLQEVVKVVHRNSRVVEMEDRTLVKEVVMEARMMVKEHCKLSGVEERRMR